MNTEPSIKLIKKEKRKAPKPQVEVEPPDDPNLWSTTVQSWVVKFQQRRRGESLRGFHRLFK